MQLDGSAIAFRADASLEIGTGHVMRCLTLADALRKRGADCHFICRTQPGDLGELIRRRGYPVHSLPPKDPTTDDRGIAYGTATDPPHAAWLHTDQHSDALETLAILDELKPDWLVVDHYAIDTRWERKIRTRVRRLMVIDDLADRHHDCDLLLDHNLGRNADNYAGLVPPSCNVLTGEKYALLRPAFAELRKASLTRRKPQSIRSLLISMGGIDKDNDTSAVLTALRGCLVPSNCRIIVAFGAGCPWLPQVEQLAATLPWETKILVDTHEMARIMSESDFAIGGGGVTGLERICLGLPSIMLETADNQKNALASFRKYELAVTAPGFQHLAVDEKVRTIERLFRSALDDRGVPRVIDSACDGLGSERVSEYLAGVDGEDRV